jgi:hypothetical protein
MFEHHGQGLGSNFFGFGAFSKPPSCVAMVISGVSQTTLSPLK